MPKLLKTCDKMKKKDAYLYGNVYSSKIHHVLIQFIAWNNPNISNIYDYKFT